MNELAQLSIDAHGGMKRWNALSQVSARIDTGGVLWALKGVPEFAGVARIDASLHEQRRSHEPFMKPGQRMRFEAGRVAIESLDGQVLEVRRNPRDAFAGHTLETPWDRLHAAYFAGYAMWNYLAIPFLFAEDGFGLEEIEAWEENGETWRRLQVRFPAGVATHSAEQVFYIGPDGLLRRHDYDVEVAQGARGAHYIHDYKEFDGIMVPTRRRVYIPGPDNNPLPEPLLVSIDISEVRFE
ncbi:hypothetical protein [Massilia niastensis]|uniref:hypothetical protein n=1 Tax=Massilia niastensis TaxID=544911 RepID=UPI00039B864F|nr:hypothetical protein [Massilia niastensis]